MSKYRKKPVVIEAFEWKPGMDPKHIPAWFTTAEITEERILVRESVVEIVTLEGIMTAQPGDWIIKGVAGEIYPCKPEIFVATYDKVAD